MARLIFKSSGAAAQPLELKWGLTRVGRGADNDYQIEHPTVSTHHCELSLSLDAVVVRDCGSTNGTSIDGRRITEETLQNGQTLRLGDVDLVLELADVNVSVPVMAAPRRAASVVLADGRLSCLQHPDAPAVWHCTKCQALSCAACIHHLHRPGGAHHYFCPKCSGACERVGQPGEKKKKNAVLAFLEKTLHLGGKKESGDRK